MAMTTFENTKRIYANNLIYIIKNKGWLFGILFWLINILLRSAALSVIVFTRKNIGNYSLNIFLLVFSFIMVNTFSHLIFERDNLLPLTAFTDDLILNPFNVKNSQSKFMFAYSYVILIKGLIHVLRNQFIVDKPFEMDRGPSIFAWLLDKSSSKIDNSVVNRIIEPAIIILIALIVFFVFGDKIFGYFLFISSFGLFVEEQKVHNLHVLYTRAGFR